MAKDSGCNAIHPGYSFLSENAAFARLCAQHAITFVGPQPETLALLGDKGQARMFASRCSVPVLAGTEGAVKLGFRKELEAVEEPEKRQQLYEDLVANAYEQGKATSTAAYFEIDDVIDPADSRRWISNALLSAPPVEKGAGKKGHL